MNRDGSLSTFNAATSGYDQFPILNPYVATSTLQDPNALIKANHFNKYFDACIKIQQNLFNTVGGTVVTSGYDSSSVQLAYQSVTFVASSNVTILDITAPSSMGSTPFSDPGFAIDHTVHFWTNASTGQRDSAFFKGAWSDTDLLRGDYEINLSMPQFYVSVVPVSGRQFKAYIVNVPFHSTAMSMDGSNTENFQANSYPSTFTYRDMTDPYHLAGTFEVEEPDTGSTYGKLRMYSTRSGTHKAGVILTNVVADDWDIQIGYLGEAVADRSGSSDTYTRCGLAMNYIGSTTNCSFYILALGAAPGTVSNPNGTRLNYWAQFLKVTGADLTNTTSVWGGGTVTPLLSGGSSGYIDFGVTSSIGSGGIRVTKSGSNFKAYTSNGSGGWVDRTPTAYTDSSPLAGTGGGQSPKAGFLSTAMDSTSGGGNRYIELAGPAKFIPSSFPGYTCKLDLLYLLANSNTPLESII